MAWLQDLNEDTFFTVNQLARHTTWLHGLMVDYAKYGVVLFGLAIVVAAVVSRRGEARSLAAAVWTGAGTLLALAVNQPIGHVVGEARPYAAHPSALLLVSPTTDFSFPSDHAVMAGAVAAGLLIAWRPLGLAVVSGALLMSFARVYVGAHYPGDVIAGLVVGALVVTIGWVVVGGLLTELAERLRSGALRRLLVAGEGNEDRDRPLSLRS